MDTKNTPIGILGLGDLGQKLTAQIISAGFDVIGYDPSVTEVSQIKKAVNPLLDTEELDLSKLTIASSADDVLGSADLIHWVVPASLLDELPPLQPDHLAVLHDSVMGSSSAASEARVESSQFGIAHCLMNEAKRVLVSPDHDEHGRLFSHFETIGLSPKKITVQEHDQMIARTQGVFALLINLGLADELERRSDEGDLTPSAMELKKAVAHRQSKWNKNTIDSILANDELAKFVDELHDAVSKK